MSNNKNVYLKISHPTKKGEINVSSLRKIIGFLNSKYDGEALNYNLFSLSTESEFRNNFPSIIYGGNQDFAVIKAYGNYASRILSSSVEDILDLLDAHFEEEIEHEFGEFIVTIEGEEDSPVENEYYIRSLVIQDVDHKIPKAVIDSLKNNEQNEYIINRIERIIVKSIKDQGRSMRIKTPFISISDVSFSSSVPVKSRDEVYQLAVRDVKFKLNVKLSDNWYAGLLKSRGFGEIEVNKENS